MRIALLIPFLAIQVQAETPQRNLSEPYKDILPSFNLTPEKELKARKEITVRAVNAREGFLNSQQAKRWPDTMGLFLSRGDYARMSGNTFFGYWWTTPNFVWKPEWRKVAFVAPKGVHESSAQIQPKAWTKAMEMLASQKGLILADDAPIRITGAVVGAGLDPKKDKTRGYATICEWKVQGPGKSELVYRYAVMKPTLGGAIGANLDWILSFAMGIDGQPKKIGGMTVSMDGEGLNGTPKR